MDSQGAQRPGLMTFTQKPHRDSRNCFLGYHATGQKGLEGADRRLKHPASRYKKAQHIVVLFLYIGIKLLSCFQSGRNDNGQK